jgi:hypothetical protein
MLEAADEPITHAELRGAITAEITAYEARLTRKMRDMQSEILRGIEAVAQATFARLHRLETSAADTNARLTALEERVLYLETRRVPLLHSDCGGRRAAID